MFGALFNMDNPFWRLMNLLAQLIALSVVTAVMCLPVITAGAAVTALYAVTQKIVNQEESSVLKNYFYAFRTNFRQATVTWLILLGAGALLGVDLYVVISGMGQATTVLTYLFLMLAGVWLLEISLVFPLLSRFDNTLKNTMKNALILGVSGFLPWSLLMMAVNALPIILVWYRFSWLLWVLTAMIFVGIAASALINSLLFRSLTRRLIGAQKEPAGITDEKS